jgi:hypothetical protein
MPEAMNAGRIDFISAYCDSRCERCSFTSRCSSFAARAAIGMCGDVVQGLELAFGRPRVVERAGVAMSRWLAGVEDVSVSAEESARWEREEDDRQVRLEGSSLMRTAKDLSMRAREWLVDQATALAGGADAVLREALDVVQYDVHLFWVKLYRALDGRDRDDEIDDDPVQNDWNGSAKVALICIERSDAAWRAIAASTSEPTPLAIADQFRDLRQAIEQEFPNAWRFVRPGFDEPGR